ncbi:MAG TPA: hypothetical protein VF952_02840 [Chloroflexia bacterium]|jgi:hypothetical protein
MHEIAYDDRRSSWVGYVWCATTDEGTQQYYWSLSYAGELDQETAKDELFESGTNVIPDSEFYETIEEAKRNLEQEMDKYAPVEAERQPVISWIGGSDGEAHS